MSMWPAAAAGATFYYNDLAAAEAFYLTEIGLTVVSRSPGRVVMQIASASFLTLADGSAGLAGGAKATAIAILTNTLDEVSNPHIVLINLTQSSPNLVTVGRPRHRSFAAPDGGRGRWPVVPHAEGGLGARWLRRTRPGGLQAGV